MEKIIVLQKCAIWSWKLRFCNEGRPFELLTHSFYIKDLSDTSNNQDFLKIFFQHSHLNEEDLDCIAALWQILQT